MGMCRHATSTIVYCIKSGRRILGLLGRFSCRGTVLPRRITTNSKERLGTICRRGLIVGAILRCKDGLFLPVPIHTIVASMGSIGCV